MQITPAKINNVQIYKPEFQGLKLKSKTLKDFFQKSQDKGLEEITGFYMGIFGTQCKGSKPLKNFIKTFEYNNLQTLIKKGQSTNDKGQAFSFLKTSAKNPISTSKVYDCSVMYLYNKQTDTHFLYHIYKDNKYGDIDYLIKTCMKEGYTHATIVPGAKFYKEIHESYLPKVFDAIRQNSKDAIINVYHFSSAEPEIVFLKGSAYEIPNLNGHATFPINDYKTYETFHEVGRCKTIEELNTLNTQIKHQRIDKEIRKILQDLIKDRKKVIEEIQSCKTEEELDIVAEKYDGGRKIKWSPDSLGCRGYYDVIKKQSFKIAGQKK